MSGWNGRIAGTPLVVDNFTVGAAAAAGGAPVFFCSHAHKDHTVGLTSSWSVGSAIYCSEATRALLLLEYGPALESRLRPLTLEQPHVITTGTAATQQQHESRKRKATGHAGGDEGREEAADVAAASAGGPSTPAQALSFSVTLFPSNHCPGSVMFLFDGPWGRVLHTGDFRYSPAAFHSSALQSAISYNGVSAEGGGIDALYMDATFLNPTCVFPPQGRAAQECVDAVRRLRDRHMKQPLSAVLGGGTGATAAASTAAANTTTAASSSPATPAEVDWRVYVSAECLGSEEVLEALFAEFGEPFFVETAAGTAAAAAVAAQHKPIAGSRHAASAGAAAAAGASSPPAAASAAAARSDLTLRANQLRVLARLQGAARCRLLTTDPTVPTHFELAPARDFQRFAQRKRQERAENKRNFLIAAAQRTTQAPPLRSHSRVGSRGVTSSSSSFSMFDSLGNDGFGGSSGLSAASLALTAHQLSLAEAAPPPLSLFLKPSTQWFVHHSTARAREQMRHSAMTALPLQSSYLARGAVEFSPGLALALAEEQHASSQQHDKAHWQQQQQQQLFLQAESAGLPSFVGDNAHGLLSASQGNPSSTGHANNNCLPVRGDDRFGVTHVLYSMHSDVSELASFVRFLRPRVIVPINIPVGCEINEDDNGGQTHGGAGGEGASYGLYGYGAADAATADRTAFGKSSGANSPRSGGGNGSSGLGGVQQRRLLAWVERVLASRVPSELMPLVRGTDFRPEAMRSELATAAQMCPQNPYVHAPAVSGPVIQPAVGSWEAMLRAHSPAAAAVAGPMQPVRSHSSPVKVPHRPGDTNSSVYERGCCGDSRVQHALPACKRLRLAVPPSPLDKLGGGLLGLAVPAAAAICGLSKSSATAAPVGGIALTPQRCCGSTPFDPRNLASRVFFLERDMDAPLRNEVAQRLQALGATVRHWIPNEAAVGSTAAAAAAASSQEPSPLAECDFVLLAARTLSSMKLLLPRVIKKVSALMAASAADAVVECDPTAAALLATRRNWQRRPLYICTVELLLWLEAANDAQGVPGATPVGGGRTDAAPSPPSTQQPPLRVLGDHLAWKEICLWNSRTRFEPLQPAMQPS